MYSKSDSNRCFYRKIKPALTVAATTPTNRLLDRSEIRWGLNFDPGPDRHVMPTEHFLGELEVMTTCGFCLTHAALSGGSRAQKLSSALPVETGTLLR
jgi:hypothetical protein